MIRHYFISDDLDDLNAVEQELLEAGIDPAQLRVLSDHNQSNAHKVDEVDSLSRRDIIHSGLVGGVIGLGVAAIIIGVGYYSGASSLEILAAVYISFYCCCVLLHLGRRLVWHSSFKRSISPVRISCAAGLPCTAD